MRDLRPAGKVTLDPVRPDVLAFEAAADRLQSPV